MQKIVKNEPPQAEEPKHFVRWCDLRDMNRENFIALLTEKQTLYILSESTPPIKITLATFH